MTWKYYMVNYHKYKNVFEFFNYINSLKEQINDTNIEMTSNKRTLLCLTIAL